MKKILSFFNKYENYLSPVFMIGGFVLDNLTLRRPDLFEENLLLLMYLIVAGTMIVFLNFPKESKFHSFYNFLLFFAFGGLFSIFTVFYVRGSSIWASWPFLTLIFGAMIGTEFLKKQYKKMTIQIGIYFLAIFSFLIFHLPIVTGIMNEWIFIASGIFSILIITFYCWLAERFTGRSFFHKINIIVIFLIWVLVNIMYFLNIIPPAPLALRESEIAWAVIKTPQGYNITDERNDKKKIFGVFDWEEKISVVGGGRVFFLSSIFSPIKIQVKIIHRWQMYDNVDKIWKDVARVKIEQRGGRESGYRSYSYLNNVVAGRWRVRVETENGQVVGIHNFWVEDVKYFKNLPESETYLN